MEKEGNLAQKILESGKIIQNPRELKRIANEVGYTGKESKEGYKVLCNEGILTVIPKHKVSIGVYRSILKALATGKSNYGRRTSYSSQSS